MPTMNFNGPQELLERIKTYMAEQGLDNQSQFIREAIEAAMMPKVEQDFINLPATNPMPTPAGAADMILSLLPEAQRNLILDCAQEHGRPPLDFILSYCKLADERGETPTLVAESVAEDDDARLFPKSVGPSPIGQTARCEYEPCGKTVTLTRRGQRFCPDPDDGTEGCGRKSTLAELHKRRPQTPSVQHKLAQAMG